jgi:hypothetical protein
MTMHLHHPSLSLSGKKKGKQKFRNADEARKARELDASWNELQKKWGVEAQEKKRKRALSAPVMLPTQAGIYRRDTGPRIPSLNGGMDMSAATLPPAKVYTGTKIKGIGTMHKSNAVPIFSDEQAVEISQMRR